MVTRCLAVARAHPGVLWGGDGRDDGPLLLGKQLGSPLSRGMVSVTQDRVQLRFQHFILRSFVFFLTEKRRSRHLIPLRGRKQTRPFPTLSFSHLLPCPGAPVHRPPRASEPLLPTARQAAYSALDPSIPPPTTDHALPGGPPSSPVGASRGSPGAELGASREPQRRPLRNSLL